MRKLLLMLLVISSTSLYAQDAIDIHLKGGKVINGYFKAKYLKDNVKEFKYSTTPDGSDQTLPLTSIDSIVVTADTSVIVPLTWVEHSELHIGSKDREKGLFLRIYKGKKLDGYVTFSGTNNWTPTGMGTMHNYSYNPKYLYKVKGERHAIAYYKIVNGGYDGNARLLIKQATKKEHPKLYEFVKSDAFIEKSQGVSEHPEILFPLFDEVLGK